MTTPATYLEDQIISQHAQQSPPVTGEPLYTKLAPVIQQTILDRCTRTTYITDGNGQVLLDTAGNRVQEQVVVYEDLYDVGHMLLTHLSRTTYYTEKEAKSAYWSFYGRIYKRLWAKYRARRDNRALNILTNILELKKEIIMGDAKEGRRQLYDVKMAGSYSTVDVRRNEKSGGFLDRLRGGG